MLANAVSVMSNILATFLREACPHVGAHFWVRLPVAYLYFCVRTFCVNISTGHAARPAPVAHFCVGVPRGYPAYLKNGDRIAKAFSGYSSQFTN